MADSEQLVLFDLPSQRPCKAWSLNPWKTRFLLNYKGLDYRTEWTEYPDLKTKLEKHLNPSNESSTYTSPTVIFPDGTYLSDSRIIATEVEKRYPSPSVHLDSPVLPKLEAIMPQLMGALMGIYIPLVPVRLLNEASQVYWYKTREAKYGMPLSQLAEEKGGTQAWTAAKPYLLQITDLLKEDDSGPFFLGQEVSYADFVWGGFLIFMQRIGMDVWRKVLETVGEGAVVHSKLLLGLDSWSVRSDR